MAITVVLNSNIETDDSNKTKRKEAKTKDVFQDRNIDSSLDSTAKKTEAKFLNEQSNYLKKQINSDDFSTKGSKFLNNLNTIKTSASFTIAKSTDKDIVNRKNNKIINNSSNNKQTQKKELKIFALTENGLKEQNKTDKEIVSILKKPSTIDCFNNIIVETPGNNRIPKNIYPYMHHLICKVVDTQIQEKERTQFIHWILDNWSEIN